MPRTHLTEYDAEALRAQILDNQITVDALSYETARALLAYEIDRTETDNCDEPTILDALLQRLDGTDIFDHAHEVVPEARYTELVRQATKIHTVRRMPTFKKIILIAAAVILLSSLGLTVYASYLGPFEGFVDNIKDLFGIEVGEIHVNGNEELAIDNTCSFFDDMESLLEKHSYDILFPKNYPTKGKDAVMLFRSGQLMNINVQYPCGTLDIHIQDASSTEEDFRSFTPTEQTFVVNGLTYYACDNKDGIQYTMFDNNNFYVIIVKTHADFLAIAEHMEKPS